MKSMKNDYQKIDAHAHMSLERVERRPSHWDPLDNYTADHMEMTQHLMSQNIVGVVSLTGGGAGGEIDKALEIARQHPGFFHFSCNFNADDKPEEVYDIMSRCKERGAVSVGELAINQWIDSPLITAIFSAAEKLSLPVTFHMSPEPGYAYGICDKPGLPLLEEALKNFPRLKFIGHSQTFWLEISGDSPREGNKERSRVGEGPITPGGAVPRLFDNYPNLFADLSAYSGYRAIIRDEPFGLKFMEKYQDRLLFGTDTINKRQTIPLGSYLDGCLDNGSLSQQAYEKICRENAQKVFNIHISI